MAGGDYESWKIHLSGTVIKYFSIAKVKRCLYCSGWMMVGSALPANMATDLPMFSTFFAISYWTTNHAQSVDQSHTTS